jgi:hypothetical protein
LTSTGGERILGALPVKPEERIMGQPAYEPCRERDDIVASIRAAVGQVLYLHRLEIEALLKSDTEEVERIEDDLRKAMVFKRSLLERFHSHLQAHGCK